MIKQNTVLVLGAGASMEFGFPSGRELMQKVCIELDPDSRGAPHHPLRAELGYDSDQIDAFVRALSKSGRQSVDAFLEHRREFLDVGKAAIASVLITRENERELFPTKGPQNWYQYLYSKMGGAFQEFAENRLSVVTFNYDRSLEHFLFTCLTHSYGRSEEQCAEALGTVPIIHVHGSLGPHPYQDPKGRPYERSTTKESIQQCVDHIRIVHETDHDDPVFQEAQKLLHDADVVCFLGFAYHPDNVRRLGLRPVSRRDRAVYGSAFGLTSAETCAVEALCACGGMQFGAPGLKILEVLREKAILC